jgi:flagellar basal-body rod protein FlgF
MDGVLKTGVNFTGQGLYLSTMAMNREFNVLKIIGDNVANFGMPGYQKKITIIPTFAEQLESTKVEGLISHEVGRLRVSGKPLDVALKTPGYLQKLDPATNRVVPTRDGRMLLDKDGGLKSLDGFPMLSSDGTPIKLPRIPENLAKEVKITQEGRIVMFDTRLGTTQPVATLGLVDKDGNATEKVEVRQGYVEDSNVIMYNEVNALMLPRRSIEANRQLFLIQSDGLSKVIQELGRAQ